MGNPRPEKVAVVDEVRERLGQADAAILTEYRGLTVKELAALRRSLREAGGEYRVYKNTLVRFAARDLGLAELDPLLTGPTAITFVGRGVDGRTADAAEVAKALRDYARTNPRLVVKGGVLGNRVVSAADTTALAELPSREVMLARLAGAFAAPMQQFAGLLQALPRNLGYGLKALIDQRGGAPAAETPPETVADTASEAAAGDTPGAQPAPGGAADPEGSATPAPEGQPSGAGPSAAEAPEVPEVPEVPEAPAAPAG